VGEDEVALCRCQPEITGVTMVIHGLSG